MLIFYTKDTHIHTQLTSLVMRRRVGATRVLQGWGEILPLLQQSVHHLHHRRPPPAADRHDTSHFTAQTHHHHCVTPPLCHHHAPAEVRVLGVLSDERSHVTCPGSPQEGHFNALTSTWHVGLLVIMVGGWAAWDDRKEGSFLFPRISSLTPQQTAGILCTSSLTIQSPLHTIQVTIQCTGWGKYSKMCVCVCHYHQPPPPPPCAVTGCHDDRPGDQLSESEMNERES